MFLGFARGKVGSVVFSRANGQQITRAKADVVRNPQTQAQTIQRIFLNTIAQAYSAMSAICDHSFEGLQKGQQSMSYFMKQNMNALRSRVAQERAAGANFDEIFEFSPLGSNYFAINDYVVAKGQLPQVAAIDDSADATMAFALDANTYQGVIDKYGLQRGDQITFVGIAETSTGVKSFKFVRVILDPREANGDEAPLSTAFITDGAITKPSPKNEGSLSDLAFTTDHVSFGFGSDYLRGAAIIVSRKGDDGNWLRSNATLVANPSSSALVYDLQRCLDLFAEGGLDVTNPRYLNNSGVSNVSVLPAKIASATINGVAIQRGGTVANSDAYTGTIVVENIHEGVNYKVGVMLNGTLRYDRDVTGTSVSWNTMSGVDLSGGSLVLQADGVTIDTYCSFA